MQSRWQVAVGVVAVLAWTAHGDQWSRVQRVGGNDVAAGLAALMAPGALEAGLGILGGRKSSKEVRRAQERELAAQKEFAQHGVRWRVEDAKAAGLHPLYALGAQLPSYSPSYQMAGQEGQALAAAGQSLARGMISREEREARSLSVRAAEKSLEESDARILALQSEAARNMAEANSFRDFPGGVAGGAGSLGVVPEGQAPMKGIGMTEVVATQTPTRSSEGEYLAAGNAPLLRKYDTPFGPVLLPSSTSGDASEAVESLESPFTFGMVLAANIAHYGSRVVDFFKSVEAKQGRARVRSYRRSRGQGSPVRYRTGGGF